MAQSHARRLVCHGLVFIVTLGMAPLYAQSAVTAGDDEEHTSIRGALESSLRLATMQHLLRIGVQEKTRAELGGSFFGDYRRSLRVPKQWGDGDPGRTNYVGHPVQGAASGFIWIDNDPRAPRAFSVDGRYWTSRLRATGWAAGYSLQFEVGPFSEASIGNVGLQPQTAGWVDHVVTPTGAFAVMVGEDALDRFLIARLERKVGSPIARAALRMFLNPSRATANVAALRSPWHRSNRPFSSSSHPPDVAP